jgi:hypothetical protein
LQKHIKAAADMHFVEKGWNKNDEDIKVQTERGASGSI